MENLVHLLAVEPILRTTLGEKVSPQEAKLLNLPTPALQRCKKDLESLCLDAGMTLGCKRALLLKYVGPPIHIYIYYIFVLDDQTPVWYFGTIQSTSE